MTTDTSAENRLPRLVGSWEIEIATSQQGDSTGLITFSSDGTVLADEAPVPLETTGHGAWVATGPLQAAYTLVALVGNAEGGPASRIKVVGALTYDAQADSWRGPFRIEVRNASGEVALTDQGTISGTRIAVELLS
jgi:hypothetical protein